MRLSPSLFLLLVAALAGSGCRHDGAAAEAGPPMEPRAAALAEPTLPAGDAIRDPAGLPAAFASTDMRLVIRTDGRYSLRTAEEAGVASDSSGLWTLETGTGQLLLVPHAADEPRRRFAMPSPDELAPEDGGPSLHRLGAVAAR